MECGEFREVEAIVDTGAAYTTLPGQILREMGTACGLGFGAGRCYIFRLRAGLAIAGGM